MCAFGYNKMINLKDLAECLKLLQDIFDDRTQGIAWLNLPNPKFGRFGGESPMTMLADGRAPEVIKILRKMQIQWKNVKSN